MDILASLLTGGATGLLGSLLSGIFGYFEEKRCAAHEIEMRKLDLEEMDKEWQYRERAADREQRSKLDTSADSLMSASYAADSATYTGGRELPVWGVAALLFVDLIRGLVRPSLTILLMYMVYSTRLEVRETLAAVGTGGLSAAEAIGIYQEVISTIMYCSTTALLWWFGSRQIRTAKKA